MRNLRIGFKIRKYMISLDPVTRMHHDDRIDC